MKNNFIGWVIIFCTLGVQLMIIYNNITFIIKNIILTLITTYKAKKNIVNH